MAYAYLSVAVSPYLPALIRPSTTIVYYSLFVADHRSGVVRCIRAYQRDIMVVVLDGIERHSKTTTAADRSIVVYWIVALLRHPSSQPATALLEPRYS